LLLRIGELERKTALTFWLTLADRETEYRYSIDPLDDESNILINLEPEDRIYDNDYVQIFKLSNYLAIPQTVPVTSYHLGE
jgi:hypothetical protein